MTDGPATSRSRLSKSSALIGEAVSQASSPVTLLIKQRLSAEMDQANFPRSRLDNGTLHSANSCLALLKASMSQTADQACH